MYTSKFIVFYKEAQNPSYQELRMLEPTNHYSKYTQKQHESALLNSKEEHMISFFVSAHDEGSKAFDSRIETANNWSDTGKYYINPYLQQKRIEVSNTPRKGFKFVNTARRYSTSNVLFRIEHPEGYIFEISAENALEIIENCTIIEGTIQDELFLDNHKYLLNNKSKKYQALLEFNKKGEETKSLIIGASCVINIHEWYSSNPRTEYNVQYLGKMHCIAVNEKKSSIQHVFRDINDKILFCTDSSLKSDFVKFCDMMFDILPEDIYHLVQKQIHKGNVYGNYYKQSKRGYDVVWAQKRPIEYTDLEEVYTILSSLDLTNDGCFENHIKAIHITTNSKKFLEQCYGYNGKSFYSTNYENSQSWGTVNYYSQVSENEFLNLLNSGLIFSCKYKFTKNFKLN